MLSLRLMPGNLMASVLRCPVCKLSRSWERICHTCHLPPSPEWGEILAPVCMIWAGPTFQSFALAIAVTAFIAIKDVGLCFNFLILSFRYYRKTSFWFSLYLQRLALFALSLKPGFQESHLLSEDLLPLPTGTWEEKAVPLYKDVPFQICVNSAINFC